MAESTDKPDGRWRILKYLELDGWEEFDHKDTILMKGETAHVFIKVVEFDDGRKQSVILELLGGFYRYFSPFAQLGEISHERALNANHTLFGISTHAGLYALQNMGAVEAFDASEFVVLMQVMAHEADKIEKFSGGGDGF